MDKVLPRIIFRQCPEISTIKAVDAITEGHLPDFSESVAVITDAYDTMVVLARSGRMAMDQPASNKPKPAGRPRLTEEQQYQYERRVLDWNRAKESGEKKKDYCDRRGIDLKELNQAINYESTQKRRKNGR